MCYEGNIPFINHTEIIVPLGCPIKFRLAVLHLKFFFNDEYFCQTFINETEALNLIEVFTFKRLTFRRVGFSVFR